VLGRLLPRKADFFALFARHAALTVEAARRFEGLLDVLEKAESESGGIRQLEHQADEICQEAIGTLHRTFVTPIDRGDIHSLASRLDDIMDHVEAAAQRLWLYEIRSATRELREVAGHLRRAVEAVHDTVVALADRRQTMGVITRALFAGGVIPALEVPLWVKIASAVTIGLGTYVGGRRIIRTLGMRLVKLTPVHGFAAETAASAVLLSTAYLGFPVSTPHVITTSIMGVGATERASAVKWGVSRDLFVAWLVTLPASALIGGVFAALARRIFAS
jgi:hypothetical protein